MKNWLKTTLFIVTGLFIGFINGFLGAGGGMLLVPLYIIISKSNAKIAHATAVFIIMPICVVSGIIYILRGVFSLTIFIPVAVGSTIGSVIGTFILKRFSNDVISFVFWIVMIVSGVFIIIF